MSTDLTVVIPAFNERARVLGTVDSVCQFADTRDWSYEVIVVDDGSQDDTADIVTAGIQQRPRLRCVRAERNRGKGGAIRLGIEQAQGAVIGFIDADDKTDISALEQVMAHIADGADGVIGDRTLDESDIEVARRPHREWGSQQFRRLLRWWLGLGDFPDTQCGFKFFRADVVRDLFSRMQIDGYMFDVELLLLATKSGYRVDRIPVRWRDDADSRFHPVSGSVRNLRELARIRRTHR